MFAIVFLIIVCYKCSYLHEHFEVPKLCEHNSSMFYRFVQLRFCRNKTWSCVFVLSGLIKTTWNLLQSKGIVLCEYMNWQIKAGAYAIWYLVPRMKTILLYIHCGTCTNLWSMRKQNYPSFEMVKRIQTCVLLTTTLLDSVHTYNWTGIWK